VQEDLSLRKRGFEISYGVNSRVKRVPTNLYPGEGGNYLGKEGGRKGLFAFEPRLEKQERGKLERKLVENDRPHSTSTS